MIRFQSVCAILLLILLFSGCSNNSGKLEGTQWISTGGTIEGKAIRGSAIKLEFTQDGYCIFKGRRIRYKLGSGNTIIFPDLRSARGNGESRSEILINGDTLTMTDNSGTVYFKTNGSKTTTASSSSSKPGEHGIIKRRVPSS